MLKAKYRYNVMLNLIQHLFFFFFLRVNYQNLQFTVVKTFYMAFFFIIIFVTACSRVPKGIIPERKMQQVLVDMQLADAIINADPSAFRTDEEKKALFRSVFDKHRITEAIYDSSLIWYGKNLDVYMQVNNMALTEVNKRIEEIGPIESEKVYNPTEDAVDIWSINKYYTFTPTSLSNTIIFNFRENEEYTSGCIFVLGMRVLGLSSDILSPVEVQLRAEQRDTTVVLKNTITNDGYHEIIFRSIPTQRIRQVYGYIRFNGSTHPYHKIYLNDLQMTKYLYGSEAFAKKELQIDPTN
jgi:hypothetical protein